MPAPAPAPGDDQLAALLAADPSLAAQLAALGPGAAPSEGPARLAALLAANPGLRGVLPLAPGSADGVTTPDDLKVPNFTFSTLSLHSHNFSSFMEPLVPAQ